MKRMAFLCLLLVLGTFAFAMPTRAQDETKYDVAACFRAAPNNDGMVSYPAKIGRAHV